MTATDYLVILIAVAGVPLILLAVLGAMIHE